MYLLIVIMIILSQQADSQIYTPSLSVKQVSVCVWSVTLQVDTIVKSWMIVFCSIWHYYLSSPINWYKEYLLIGKEK